MTGLIRDLRWGARVLAGSPLFTAAAVVLLSLGISASTLIFSLINAWVLRPLPVSHPENLVRLIEVHPNEFITWDHPYSLCEGAPRSASVSEFLCQGEADLPLREGGATERVRVHLVSPSFFSALGVHAHLGRVLTSEDERQASQHAVLSYDFWTRRFGRDPSVLGRQIALRRSGRQPVACLPRRYRAAY